MKNALKQILVALVLVFGVGSQVQGADGRPSPEWYEREGSRCCSFENCLNSRCIDQVSPDTAWWIATQYLEDCNWDYSWYGGCA